VTEYKIEKDYSIVFATYGLAAFIATVIIIFTGQLRADGKNKQTIKSKKVSNTDARSLEIFFKMVFSREI